MSRHMMRSDKPQYSRLFIVCSRSCTEDDLRTTFEKYGDVESIYMPRDRNTAESRGIAYVKYAKTSSAATAIEKLHMTTLPNQQKPIKVMVASDKDDTSSTNREKYKRLFVRVPKNMNEREILQTFSSYGDVESVRIQRDKDTEESKGFAYIHYMRFSDAAKAIEQCDKMYKAIFATPKEDLPRHRSSLEDNFPHSSGANRSQHYASSRGDYNNHPMTSLIKTTPKDFDTVTAVCSPPVQQKYLEKIFSIIPGMIQFKYLLEKYNNICRALITYDSKQAAAYAVETLNEFEFPSGETITVTPDSNPLSKAASSLNSIVNNLKNSVEGNSDLAQLADMIAQASSLIKAATAGRDNTNMQDDSYCSVDLPPAQPLADSNSKLAQRCFLVFKPHPPPAAVLKDVFCRFGNLIDIVTYSHKTFGFARFASVQSAQDAIKTLHGATVCGVQMKVLEAEERNTNENRSDSDTDSERKRMQGIDDSDSEVKRMKLTNDED